MSANFGASFLGLAGWPPNHPSSSRQFRPSPLVSVLCSTIMADAEFHDPERIELLEALKTALGVDVIPSLTAWACLWLSDIDRLRDLVRQNRYLLMGYFENMEHSVRIVQKCRFTNLIFL
jgi:hypothetical protein